MKYVLWIVPLCVIVLASLNHAFPSVDLWEDAQNLLLELHGTIVGIKSSVCIYDTATGKKGIYQLNGEVEGYQIIDISPGKILLEKDGRITELALIPRGGNNPAINANPEPEIYTDVSGTTVVTRRHLLKQIPKANELLAKLKILPIPQADSSKFQGFRVDNVPPGSIIDEAGIKSGDVIYSVEGKELQSTQDAWDMFNTVKKQSRFEVVLLRDNKPVTLKYQLKN